ncbi:hypothetical protein D3C72_2481600 [compost metagenome]
MRKVVTSKVSPSESTVTVPCFNPVGMVRGNSFTTSSGLAEVAISISFTGLPRCLSRT